MTQLGTEAGAGTPPAADATPPPAPTAAGQPVSTGEEFVQVPKSALQPWGGDWHAAIGHANSGQQFESSGLLTHVTQLAQQYNLSVAEVLAELGKPDAQEPAAPPPPVAPGVETATPALTEDRIGEIMTERFGALMTQRDQKRDEAQAVADRKSAVEQARTDESKACEEFLKAVGIQRPEDGSRSPQVQIAADTYFRNLYDLKAQQAPSWITDDAQRQLYMENAAPDHVMKAVAEQARKDLADFGLEGASALAQAQGQVATGTSLGAGPGAGIQLPKGDELTPAVEEELVTRGMSDEAQEELIPTAREMRQGQQ